MKTMAFYLTMLLSFFMFFSPDAKAQDIPDDEGVEISIFFNGDETVPKRTPVVIPITAYYYALSFCIEVRFIDNIGEVTVSMTNLTTGFLSNIMVNSNSGSIFLFIPNSPGLWQITFLTEGGAIYYGSFFL